MKEVFADRIMMKATKAYVGNRINLVIGAVPRLSSPVLFSANHPTTLDPLLLQYALKLSYSSLLTEVAFSVPLVGDVLKAARHVPVGKRGTGGKPLIDTVAAIARSGRPLAIFPEGCLCPGPELAPLRSGAVRIAATAHVAVVPVGIAVSRSGTREISKRFGDTIQTGRYLLRGWYVVRLGKPIRFEISPEDHHAVKESTARLASAMGQLTIEANNLLALLEGRETPAIEDCFGIHYECAIS